MSVRSVLATVGFSMALGLAAPCVAQAQADPPPDAETEIVVTGSLATLQREIKQLLATSNGQIARFEAPLCLRIIGLNAKYATQLRELILANAEAIGVPRGKSDCMANAFVIFDYRPQKLVAMLRERAHWLFGDLSLPARDRITKPVRTSYAWHANTIAPADGAPPDTTGDIPSIRGYGGGSLIRLPVIQTTATAFLVLDITRTPGMSLNQIADFATLNLLVDLDHDAKDHARADSILHLFDAPDLSAVPARMSAFDRALAKAVYTPRNLASSSRQVRGQIAAILKQEDDEVAE